MPYFERHLRCSRPMSRCRLQPVGKSGLFSLDACVTAPGCEGRWTRAGWDPVGWLALIRVPHGVRCTCLSEVAALAQVRSRSFLSGSVVSLHAQEH